jgi:hypothetical protein
MSIKRNKTLLIVGTILVLLTLFYQNLEDYQEQRIHMLINDYLLSFNSSN